MTRAMLLGSVLISALFVAGEGAVLKKTPVEVAPANRANPSWYDRAADRRAAYLAFAGYCPDKELNSWDCIFCKLQPLHVTAIPYDYLAGTKAYVGIDRQAKEVVAVFRGSSNIVNWIEDLLAIKTKPGKGFGPGKVHEGFLFAYHTIANKTKDAINKILLDPVECPNKSCRLSIIGHSLGASMALLLAADMMGGSAPNHAANTKLHTFGCPRTGDDTFHRWVGQVIGNHTSRCVNDRDIVPHLPPKYFGYHHYATEVWERPIKGQPASNFTLTVCDGSGEDPHCSDSVPIIATSAADHMKYFDVPSSADNSCPPSPPKL